MRKAQVKKSFLAAALYTANEWGRRHRVKPGITGLAQALLRSKATLRQRKRLDLFYAEKTSFLLDAIVIFKTFRSVIGKGMQN
jgi:lipopolysaccharide/colanic/teichoic acid biosynthesis glycosyltransferase